MKCKGAWGVITIMILLSATSVMPYISRTAESRMFPRIEDRRPITNTAKSDMVDVTICTFLHGNMEDHIATSISLKEAAELEEKLSMAKNLHEKLTILKKYGMLSDTMAQEPWCSETGKLFDFPFQVPRGFNITVNANCNVFSMGMMVGLPGFGVPGTLLLGVLVPIPVVGLLYAMKWMVASTITAIIAFPIISGDFPNLGYLLGYTWLSAPVGFFMTVGMVSTSGLLGNWTWVGALMNLILGFTGVWVTLPGLGLIWGKALFIVTTPF